MPYYLSQLVNSFSLLSANSNYKLLVCKHQHLKYSKYVLWVIVKLKTLQQIVTYNWNI